MNRDEDKSANAALRGQKQSRTQTVCVKKKKKETPSGVSAKETQSGVWNFREKRSKPAGTSSGRVSCSGSAENRRKLSDASNASEDTSKDSGCVSGKLSSSDCSSETSECPSESNKRDSPTGDRDLIWIDGKAYVKPGNPCAKTGRGSCAVQPDAAGGNLGLSNCSGTFVELMMGESAEDLLREVEDLRSENEYLKDELEELRCEMLEMRDMFQEEEMFQLQELRLQLEQANKMCRILQYRLRKAERRSIRVAQTGQVDGELVRSLEHDIKVAKSVSLRLYNELEAVQKKNSRLEWTNEALSEKIQQLEVVKQVLQSEVEKSRENTLKKKGSSRSTGVKAERRLSHHSEDDSADLRCQLHFAKEELAVMCKKLAKLVSEGEDMREELARYQSAYGDVDTDQSPGDKHGSVHSREAEVKVHLKLVEEEATLLSRRIVELEVENRGLRAEMSDLREKTGGGGGEEEEKQEAVEEETTAASAPGEDEEEREGEGEREQCFKIEVKVHGQETGSCQGDAEIFSEGPIAACHVTQELLVVEAFPKAMTAKDHDALVALREHCCILNSAIHFLTAPLKTGCSSAPSCVLTSPPHVALNGRKPGFLLESLELVRDMLLVFSGRVETFLTGQDSGKDSGPVGDPSARCTLSDNTADCDVDHNDAKESPSEREDVDERTTSSSLPHSCRNSKIQLYLQILWILHQWYHGAVPEVEADQGKNRTVSVLRGLLQTLEFQDEPMESKVAECADSDVIHGEDEAESSKVKQQRQQFPLQGSKKKNWVYLNQDAAQLDQVEPVKLWDHPIMPQSFPDFDSEQTFTKRSHTAPEKSAFRIYYSPPSARRVQLSQLRHSLTTDGESVHTASPWCTPLTSLSQLCLGSSTNLSDDVKEMTASWRRAVHGGSQEAERRSSGRWVDVVSSSTQTHTKPQMVSVGLQTEGTVVGRGPSRLLVPTRSHHTSASLDGGAGRAERLRASTSSPKLYHRHSGPPCFSLSSSSSSTSSTSSSSSTKDRASWTLNQENSSPGPTWCKQRSQRQTAGSPGRSKPPTKPPGPNCYGVVTEFLRRVSGRAEKPAPGSEPKTRSGLKNLECAPTRTAPAASLQRTDSVTRIVNQRFMKREEVGRAQREGRSGGGVNASVRPVVSLTSEDGPDRCSSRSTLTFCFTRPSPSTRRQASNQSKNQRHRYSHPAAAAAANCET